MSDRRFVFLNSPGVREGFKDTDLVISCGDLPYYYLESVSEILGAPLFFVRGNHDPEKEYHAGGARTQPAGCTDLHCRIVGWNQLIMAGVEGSIRYSPRSRYQYTQGEMWQQVFTLVPGLLLNRLRYGRFLDLFVTHAPPWGVHDGPDIAHQGIKAFRWLVLNFHPRVHLHGHIHVYHDDTQTETALGGSRVINTYGFQEIELEVV
jgi:Icc-related predicted phosphoesterase